MHKIITLVYFAFFWMSAFGQTSGGLPPIRSVEPSKPPATVRKAEPTKPSSQQATPTSGLPASVYFETGKIDISEAGKKTITDIVSYIGKNGKVTLRGFASRAADADFNVKVANIRVLTITGAFVSAGLSQSNIETLATEFIDVPVNAISVNRVDINLSQSKSFTSDSKDNHSISLIDEGWQSFIGARGIVDEMKAVDLTLEGIKALDPDVQPRVLSTGRNNLSVFYLCAQDPRIRDYRKGTDLSSRSEISDNFSLDNAIWSVYLQRQSVQDLPGFYRFVKKEVPAHPVNRYIEALDGKGPDSSEQAYAVLERFANIGDPNAALRIGYRYECYDRAPELNLAISWYRKAKDLYEQNNASNARIKSVADRINRLVMISEGKIAK